MKMKRIFALLLLLSIYYTLPAQEITGQWNGVFEVQGMKLRLMFHIEKLHGLYKATMASPDQGAKDIPVTAIRFNDNNLKIEVKNISFMYDGILKNDTLIEGSFTQMGNTFPLNLTKNIIEIRRPQEPKQPYSYISEDIKFDNKKANIALAGTLTYPKKGNHFPAVVLITGSGPQDRNEEIMGHKPFLVISDYLTCQGIAVLRYDDRGVGESGGDFSIATTKDFASDAMAAFEYLKTRKEINPRKIGLIGHSEGGIITFMLASEYKDIAFIVSMAGTAINGNDLLREQRQMISAAAGVSSTAFDQNEILIQELNDIISKHTLAEIKQNAGIYIDSLFPEELSGEQKKVYEQQLIRMASPWMQYFITYDPGKDIPPINCPILAINGQKDLQVNADTNLNKIKILNPDATVKKYPGLNHLFQHCKTGMPNEYSQIEETISSEVLADITKWILSK